MKIAIILVSVILAVVASTPVYSQSCGSARNDLATETALTNQISILVLENETIFEGLEKIQAQVPAGISVEGVPGAARFAYPRFTKKIHAQSVRAVLDELMDLDPRFQWRLDYKTINVFPRANAADSSYFPSRLIGDVLIRDATSAANAISQVLATAHEGILMDQLGGEYPFGQPWSASFDNCTVRQAFNRIMEHVGSTHGWQYIQTPNGQFKRLLLHAGLGRHSPDKRDESNPGKAGNRPRGGSS